MRRNIFLNLLFFAEATYCFWKIDHLKNILNENINYELQEERKNILVTALLIFERLHESIDFWREAKGKDGYFRMLEEYGIASLKYPAIPILIEEKYIDEGKLENAEN